MSRSPLRPATAPHTNKLPSECPHCGSHAVTRKGVRKKKLEIIQLWRCASCKRTFTPGPAALRNKTYPIRTVLKALTLYNLGYSLNETAKRLKPKSGRAVSPCGSCRFVDDTQNFEARDLARVFRRLPLAVVEVSWNCNHGLRYRTPEISFRGLLHLWRMKALIWLGLYFLPIASTQASPLGPATILKGTSCFSF